MSNTVVMTSGTSFYMETVSLHDDETQKTTSINGNSHTMEDLEGQRSVYKPSVGKYTIGTPLMVDSDEEEEENDNNHEHTDQVVVVVDSQETMTKSPPSLPPLRLKEIQKEYNTPPERDYVDTSLFSPEITRHSLELAHRRARALENELRELEALEHIHTSPVPSSVVKITPFEAVTIISNAFTGSVLKLKQFFHGQSIEYNLLTGTSPLNKIDDLDTDGDGLQLSPDASRGQDGKHFIPSPKIKPALKRISVYSQLGKDSKRSFKTQSNKRRLQWHEDVLDHDEEFIQEEEEEEEEKALMITSGEKKNILRQSTPRNNKKKKRKKLVRSIMRRLTPYEKEELYKERPDLMIVPNWAQKYREEMTESESTRWSVWLMVIIGTLALLLLILIMLIARDQSVHQTQVT